MFSNKLWHYIILFIAAGFGALFLSWQWTLTSNAQEMINLSPDNLIKSIQNSDVTRRDKPAAQTVKALYLTAYSAGNSKRVAEIIKLIDETELNAVVIDIKDYSGKILYNSKIKLVNDLKTKQNQIGDVAKLIRRFHEHGIYVIARQTVFQDPVLAEKKPEWGIKSADGELWRDKLGLAWVDPTNKAVWSYNLAIAKEAITLGFDEINLDYVRFPSDGNLKNVVYTNGSQPRYEVLRDFFKFMSVKLADEPAWLSIDVFGFVMERFDGLSIGQRLVDAVDNVDYICPMMYPSHYPKGYLGFDNPAEHPAEVFANGLEKGLPFFKDKRAKLRPWIQAFDMGAVYKDGVRIREQIDAIEKYTDAGWMMWNASNNYSVKGLKAE